jgi:hypothetical protein
MIIDSFILGLKFKDLEVSLFNFAGGAELISDANRTKRRSQMHISGIHSMNKHRSFIGQSGSF